MPYAIRKTWGGKWKVVNRITGKVYGTHDSRKKAIAQIAAIKENTGEES